MNVRWQCELYSQAKWTFAGSMKVLCLWKQLFSMFVWLIARLWTDNVQFRLSFFLRVFSFPWSCFHVFSVTRCVVEFMRLNLRLFVFYWLEILICIYVHSFKFTRYLCAFIFSLTLIPGNIHYILQDGIIFFSWWHKWWHSTFSNVVRSKGNMYFTLSTCSHS